MNKNSLAKIGSKNPMYGVSPSQETRIKMRLSHLGKKYKPMSEEGRKNISNSHKGKHISPATEFKGSGITNIDERQRIRGTFEYKTWQNKVYKRDNYKCRNCHEKLSEKQMVAHHIKNFNEYPDIRFEVKNGMTLCRKCHINIHRNLAGLRISDSEKMHLVVIQDPVPIWS